MSSNTLDIKQYSAEGRETQGFIQQMPVAAGATTIHPGEPVYRPLGPAAVATAATTAGPVVGTNYMMGIAATTSTQTATVAGSVDVLVLDTAVTYIGVATVPANVATQALYNALVGSRVTWTLTAGTYTINTTDGATNGLVIEPLDLSQPANQGKIAFSTRSVVFYND